MKAGAGRWESLSLPFESGLRIANGSELIDASGNTITSVAPHYLMPLCKGLLKYFDDFDGPFGLVDTSGTKLSDMILTHIWEYRMTDTAGSGEMTPGESLRLRNSRGLICGQTNSGDILIDAAGKVLYEAGQYTYCALQNGVLLYGEKGEEGTSWGVLDASGKPLSDSVYGIIEMIGESVIRAW